MGCPERKEVMFIPHFMRIVKLFPPSSGGACVEGTPPEIGLEALTLPTSRELMVVGHDYYQKAPMKMNISHGGVCIFMLGVLLSCDPEYLMSRQTGQKLWITRRLLQSFRCQPVGCDLTFSLLYEYAYKSTVNPFEQDLCKLGSVVLHE
ncbi:hypothetical protein KY284_030294 [Solanum tuberosum]|nr:hypothetical protein KY284_030294 [Solanum tuberosum]